MKLYGSTRGIQPMPGSGRQLPETKRPPRITNRFRRFLHLQSRHASSNDHRHRMALCNHPDRRQRTQPPCRRAFVRLLWRPALRSDSLLRWQSGSPRAQKVPGNDSGKGSTRRGGLNGDLARCGHRRKRRKTSSEHPGPYSESKKHRQQGHARQHHKQRERHSQTHEIDETVATRTDHQRIHWR